MTVRELDQAIRVALKKCEAPLEGNRLSVDNLRRALNEFFDTLQERFARSSAARESPQWELVAVDLYEDQPATFLLLCVTGAEIRWVIGLGEPRELRTVLDS